jgi:hypothetical protein
MLNFTQNLLLKLGVYLKLKIKNNTKIPDL